MGVEGVEEGEGVVVLEGSRSVSGTLTLGGDGFVGGGDGGEIWGDSHQRSRIRNHASRESGFGFLGRRKGEERVFERDWLFLFFEKIQIYRHG